MAHPTGHLQEHPLPSGITGALSLTGYQLLVDVGGVGVGRLGQHIFLLIVADAGPGADEMTHITLHQPRLGDERDAGAYQQLAAQLGYLRLSGYRVALERAGLHSKVGVINPATGGIALQIPAKHPGKLFGGGANVRSLLVSARGLPPAGEAPDLQNPELLRQTFLALALRDESTSGAEAAELADRALTIAQRDSTLDPVAALAAAKQG
jgi:hypothetical protein